MKKEFAYSNDSTYGNYRMVYADNSDLGIEITDKWHHCFLWEVSHRKEHVYTNREPHPGVCGVIKFEVLNYCEWAKHFSWDDYFSARKCLSENAHVVITYKRIDSPFTNELAQLQSECEELFPKFIDERRKLHSATSDYEASVEASKPFTPVTLRAKIFASKIEANRKEISQMLPEREKIMKEQQQVVSEIENEINRRLARADEIRAIVLG